jgi:hypothetical protein
LLHAIFRGLQVTACFAIIAVGLITLYVFFIGDLTTEREHGVVEYKDFVTILLTAVAVMIAVATVIVALMAVFGYTILRDEMNRTAAKIAEDKASEIARRRAEEVARERTDAMVPALVAQAVRFQGLEEGIPGDEVAAEIGREGTGNG